MSSPSRQPLQFDPSMEEPEPDEAEIAREIVDTMRSISETTFKHYGHAVRSVHAKSHGLLKGTMTILPDLTEPLAQGVAATPGARYPIVLRFSTNPGDILDDRVSTPRGLAVKLLGVEGEHLAGASGAQTQDFVLVNGPAFPSSTAKAFARNLKLLAVTTDRAEGLKKLFSAVAQRAEALLEAVGSKSPTLLSLGGQPETHILGETFYSQVPVLWGNYIAKVSIAPASSTLKALTGQPLGLDGHPNGLRDAVVAFFRTNEAAWDLRVQLCTDLETMPVEDAAKVWDEAQSPFRAVAQITVERQEGWSEPRARAVDDGLSFSPWHGLEAHRPLGSIMRVRKLAYEAGRRFRAEHNAKDITEPRTLDGVP